MQLDLRSDTVTRPTRAMFEAMAAAPLGDDVLGDDPSVQDLEERCAVVAGKDAAVFVPSGTMANLIAISVLTRPGDEVLLHEDAHPFHYESAGAAALAHVQLRPLPGPKGLLAADTVSRALRPTNDDHAPRSALLCLEDTHNRAGGRIQPIDNTRELLAVASKAGLRAHLDGARLFNASVATGDPIAKRAAGFDTVSFCFSKGLGCPAGSVLCGSDVVIREARRVRKRLGGGMRQSGLLAAACSFALDHHVLRLAEDHALAREAAMGLMLDGFEVELPETNLLLVKSPDAADLARRLGERGVRCFAVAPDRVRLAFHLDVPRDAVTPLLRAFRDARA